jgi:hypothetical protein
MANNNIYIVAQYVAKPKNKRLSSQPGYMSNPDNIQWDERMYVSQGLRKKDHEMNVILDLTEEKIIKNSFDSSKSFEEVFKYFYENYGDYIDDCVNKINETIQAK